MTKSLEVHPVYCSCCPSKPQVVAQKVGDHLLEIHKRVHGQQHYAVVLLDKPTPKGIDSTK